MIQFMMIMPALVLNITQGTPIQSRLSLDSIPPYYRRQYAIALKGDLFAMLLVNQQRERMALEPLFPWEEVYAGIQRLADQGNPHALSELVKLYWREGPKRGMLVVSDRARAGEIFEKAVALGEPRAIAAKADSVRSKEALRLREEHNAKFKNLPPGSVKPEFKAEIKDPIVLYWNNQAAQAFSRQSNKMNRENVLGLLDEYFSRGSEPPIELKEQWRDEYENHPVTLYHSALSVLNHADTKEKLDEGWRMLHDAAEKCSWEAMVRIAEDFYMGSHGTPYEDPNFTRDPYKAKEWADRLVEYVGSEKPLLDNVTINGDDAKIYGWIRAPKFH